MIVVQEFDKEALKEQLNLAKEPRTFSAAALKRICKENGRDYDRAYESNKRLRSFYSLKALPVRIEGLVINFHFYQTFIKKLKNFDIEESVVEGVLIIRYWVPGKRDVGGQFSLFDLSGYYEGFNLPEALIS